MPYRRVGGTIYIQVGRKWVVYKRFLSFKAAHRELERLQREERIGEKVDSIGYQKTRGTSAEDGGEGRREDSGLQAPESES